MLYGLLPAGASPPTAPPLCTGYADVTLRWKAGKVTVEKLVQGRFATPTALRRFVGRFEVQVLAHGKQLDALRFDFPFLADADAGTQQVMADRLRAGVDARTTVRVPLPDGADSLLVVDRRAAAGAQPLVIDPATGVAATGAVKRR